MKNPDLISVYMEFAFGTQGCRMLKSLVNKLLDKGEWHDNFDLGVWDRDLDYEECRILLNSVKKSYPDSNLDVEGLKVLIERHLPQSQCTKISWLVGDDGSIVITDSLRVGRFKENKLLWVTKRISLDGINLHRIFDEKVECECYLGYISQNDWHPFLISFIDGSLIKGEECEF